MTTDKVTAEIDEYDEHNPRIIITVAGKQYTFSVRGFPADHHDWLCEVLARHFQNVNDDAVRRTTATFQRQLRQLAGLEK